MVNPSGHRPGWSLLLVSTSSSTIHSHNFTFPHIYHRNIIPMATIQDMYKGAFKSCFSELWTTFCGWFTPMYRNSLFWSNISLKPYVNLPPRLPLWWMTFWVYIIHSCLRKSRRGDCDNIHHFFLQFDIWKLWLKTPCIWYVDNPWSIQNSL